METEQKNIANWAATAGKAERIAEFKYPYADVFFVSIAYASRFVLNQIRQLAAEPYTDRRTRTREERLDDGKLQLGYAERIIKGWRGFNVGKLEKIIPGTLDEAIASYEEAKKKNPELKVPSVEEIKKMKVDYSVQTAQTILSNSVDFMNWVVEIAGNAENYSAVAAKKKKEYENLD